MKQKLSFLLIMAPLFIQGVVILLAYELLYCPLCAFRIIKKCFSIEVSVMHSPM